MIIITNSIKSLLIMDELYRLKKELRDITEKRKIIIEKLEKQKDNVSIKVNHTEYEELMSNQDLWKTTKIVKATSCYNPEFCFYRDNDPSRAHEATMYEFGHKDLFLCEMCIHRETLEKMTMYMTMGKKEKVYFSGKRREIALQMLEKLRNDELE